MEFTKRAISLILTTLLVSFAFWLFTNPDKLVDLGLCGSIWCSITYLLMISAVVIFLGALIDLIINVHRKIKKPLKFVDRVPEITHSGEKVCVSIEIHNESDYDIESCYLRIKTDAMS